jgi:hypothetical protein
MLVLCCFASSPVALLRLRRIRDAALATGVLSNVLSFLPIEERLREGQVSKHWRQEMQHPSLCRNVGWHLTRHVSKANALSLPPWLCARLSAVRCSVDWLLYATPFARFRQLKNVRHLDLLVNSLGFSMATTKEDALREHLTSLPLLSLRLPLLCTPLPHASQLQNAGDLRLISLITQAEANSHAPSPLTSWSASLTHLRCELFLLPNDPLLTALTTQRWPKLCKLQLILRCTGSAHALAALEQLHRSVLPSSMPSLMRLELDMRHSSHAILDRCACTDWWTQLLPGLSTLTTLKLKFPRYDRPVGLLGMLYLVSADAMPQLTQLTLDPCDFLPLSDDERAAAIALLQRMPLTQLTHAGHSAYRSSGFQLLHSLPHLSMCTLHGRCCAESVAAVPSLEELICAGCGLANIAERWWRRCGCPPLQHAGFVDEQEWQEHWATRAQQPADADMVGTPAPVIRVLRCGIVHDGPLTSPVPVFVWAFPYLAHLPHLRELECCLREKDLRALGLLTQLENLCLWLTEQQSGAGLAWNNDAVRILGALPLQRLRSLRLEGVLERDRPHEGMLSSDPDFSCQ